MRCIEPSQETSVNNHSNSKPRKKAKKAGIKKRTQHTGFTSEDVAVEVEVVDFNMKNRSSTNHESAAMSEVFKSDSGDNDRFDKNTKMNVHFLLLTLTFL